MGLQQLFPTFLYLRATSEFYQGGVDLKEFAHQFYEVFFVTTCNQEYAKRYIRMSELREYTGMLKK
jgi:hypothetical protein